jgi:hypothetical protein
MAAHKTTTISAPIQRAFGYCRVLHDSQVEKIRSLVDWEHSITSCEGGRRGGGRPTEQITPRL